MENEIRTVRADAAAAAIPDKVLDALQQAAANGTRIASICSGAFILAATGLLDGLRATTHWLATGLLADLHPAIEVDPDVLYVDNGQLLTSAGAAAGLDLLEVTDHPVDRIAAQVGFGSTTALRDRFKRIVGTSPHSYRTAFQRTHR